MDRRVKERLVGASILVVLIVLIVPELLSGPVPAPATARLPVSAPEPVRNITVDLTTSKAPAADAASVPEPLAASSTSDAGKKGSGDTGANAAGASSAAPAASRAASPAVAPAAAAATPAPLENARPSPRSVATPRKSASARWAVQLGSFASHENADKLARRLKAQGFAVYVLPGGSGSTLRYRVRVGPMADRGAAAQTAAKLKTLGQTASLVAPAP